MSRAGNQFDRAAVIAACKGAKAYVKEQRQLKQEELILEAMAPRRKYPLGRKRHTRTREEAIAHLETTDFVWDEWGCAKRICSDLYEIAMDIHVMAERCVNDPVYLTLDEFKRIAFWYEAPERTQ